MGKSKGNANCNQVILDHFWNISDQSEEKRCRSSQVILQTLTAQIKGGSRNDVSYCLDRLIRGLISTRDFARHGFCVLLTRILAQFPEQSDLSEVFALAQKEYGTKVAESTSESAISWALLIGCILKSGRVSLDTDAEIVNQLFDYLFRLGIKKSYVEIIVCNLLPLYFDIFKEKPKKFKKLVLEQWKEQQHQQQQNSVFYAYFIFLAKSSFPDKSEEYFNEFFSANIYQIGSNDYSKVLSLLKETTKYYPNVHPLNELLVKTLHELDNDNFSHFCSSMVNNIFNVNLEKTSLGFEITRILLQFANSEQVQLILSSSFMRLFIQTLSNKKHPLHNGAIELGNYFVQLAAEKREDSDFQVAFAKCFITKPGSINFDELSKSRILASILKTFSDDSIRAWILMLKDMMIDAEEIPASDFTRIRCLQQISHLIKSYNGDEQLLWAVSKFFFVYAYFDVSATKKNIALDDETVLEQFKSPISEKLQKQFPDSFKSTFAHLCQVVSNVGATLQQEKLQKQIAALQTMGDFIVSLLGKKKLKLISSSEQTSADELKQAVDDLRAKIEQIDSLTKPTVQSNIFKLLHLYFVIELFENSEEILSILPDFSECTNRSLFVGKKSKKSDEPLWADVLTDLLLSLLTTKSKYTKSVITSAFKHISPFISSVGLQSLTEAVLKDKDAFNTDSDDELDDEEMDEAEGDEANDIKDEEVEEESEDDDDDDEDLMDDAEDGEVDEQLKLDLKRALGSAADDDEEADSDDDDAMSDSEMFKFDDSLAEVFRKKFGDKKRANEQRNLIQTFKHRALELIQIVIEQKEMSLEMTFELLSSVLLVAKSHYAVKSMVPITAKCIHILTLISKKRFPSEENQLDEDTCRKVLLQLIQMQYKCSHSDLQKSLVIVSSWLLLTVSKTTNLSSTLEMFSSTITRSLRDLFDRSNAELKPELFVRLIPQLCELEKKPFIKSEYFDILVEYSFKAEIRSFKRSTALDILCSLVKPVDATSGQAQATLAQLATRAISLLIDELTNLAETKQPKQANANKQIRLQYINLLIKLAIACRVFESENTKIAALLKQVNHKLTSTPKECRKKLNKMFISKMKTVAVN